MCTRQNGPSEISDQDISDNLKDGGFLFCGATTMDATYRILSANPHHVLLQDAVQHGVMAVLWGEDIQLNELRWIKDEGNRYQDGWEPTFVEMIADTPSVLGEWEMHCTASGTIDRGQLPQSGPGSFYALQKTWFEQNYLKQFGHYSTFLWLKSFVATLEEFTDSQERLLTKQPNITNR